MFLVVLLCLFVCCFLFLDKAFCYYVAKSKSIELDRPASKKLKMDSIFDKLNTEKGIDGDEGFSFGFRLIIPRISSLHNFRGNIFRIISGSN